jgi:hypothetical protein
MAKASGVIELKDEEVLHFIERSEAANTVGTGEDKERPEYLVSCTSHSLKFNGTKFKISSIE